MFGMRKNSFNKAYREIEKLIKTDDWLIKRVRVIALLGSASDKEISETWSDLDILLVIKNEPSGNIPFKVYEKIRDIVKKISSKYNFPISILPHTEDDFEKYVCFEYLIHYSRGTCTYPDNGALKRIIGKILRKRGVDEKVRRAYCVYHLRHIRFNLMRKYVSLNKRSNKNSLKEFGKLLIDKMIKVTDLILNYYNIWATTKSEIYSQAKNRTDLNVSTLKKALILRKKWATITDREIEIFIPDGIDYIYTAINSILNNHLLPTPEENMGRL